MEVIPAISMALFAHIVDQKEKKGLLEMYFGFFSNQFRTILLTWPVVHDYSLKRFCTPSTFSFSWWISSSL
jgi:hypothetical protein